jgi:hypothetical protein
VSLYREFWHHKRNPKYPTHTASLSKLVDKLLRESLSNAKPNIMPLKVAAKVSLFPSGSYEETNVFSPYA